jgi:hypothetical protein
MTVQHTKVLDWSLKRLARATVQQNIVFNSGTGLLRYRSCSVHQLTYFYPMSARDVWFFRLLGAVGTIPCGTL